MFKPYLMLVLKFQNNKSKQDETLLYGRIFLVDIELKQNTLSNFTKVEGSDGNGKFLFIIVGKKSGDYFLGLFSTEKKFNIPRNKV